MKLTNAHKTLAAVFAVALTAFGFTAHASDSTCIPGVAEQPASYFYTGKPYDSDLGSYTFNARNYNPEINRWTSADPSGFPDGSNNFLYVNNSVFSNVDANGLIKKALWLYAYSGNPLVNDTSAQQEFADQYGAYYQKLVTADQKNPSPHFVNDGDWFDYNTIGSLNDIASFSMYDQVYIGLHGVVNGAPDQYGIGGQLYSEAQIRAAGNNITDVYGCQPGGTAIAAQLASRFFSGTSAGNGTANYLKDSVE